MRQFQVHGIEIATGKPVEYRLRAVDAHAVRAHAKLEGIEVRQVAEERPHRSRLAILKSGLSIGCGLLLVVFFVGGFCVGLVLVIQERIHDHQVAKAREEHMALEHGPHWRQAVEFVDDLLSGGNIRASPRSGWTWYVDPKAIPSYNQVSGEYSVGVHSYGPGRNPLNGENCFYRRVVVAGAPGSWTFVRFD